jgi:putative tricarboxylic transport membrane protein
MSEVTKGTIVGAFFALMGGYFLLASLVQLNVGTAAEMGAGYFPMLVGGLVALLGLITFGQALSRQLSVRSDAAVEAARFPWRAIVSVSAALVLFAILIRPAGLIVTIVIACAVAALASSRPKPARVAAMVGSITLFSWLIFSLGMELRIPAFGSMLAIWR